MIKEMHINNKTRPHDIVRIRTDLFEMPADQKCDHLDLFKDLNDLSSLALHYLKISPFHVVRRAPIRTPHNIPETAIGIRGDKRSERFGIYIPTFMIDAVYPPEQLFNKTIIENWDRAWQFPAISETLISFMDTIAILNNKNFDSLSPFGIGGSLGYELVSGTPVIHQQSDIDLIWYLEHPLPLPLMQTVLDITTRLKTPIDIQIQNQQGAFHLSEYLKIPGKAILLKTDQGPVLSNKIWTI